MSERQALHGGPFEPRPQGPAPGPGPPALLAAQDGWMVAGGPPYQLLAVPPQESAPFGSPFEPQFNKVAPCFPFPPGFGFAPKEPSDEPKDEGLTARLLDKPPDGSSPRAGTPAGGVGYRPWEQEGYEGTRPPDKPERPFSNGQDKGGGSPGLGSQDSSQSSERMPTPVDKMAAQHPAPPFPMQHHPFADFPPHPAVFFDKGSGEEPSFQVPSVSSTTTRHKLLTMAPEQPSHWADQQQQQQRNGLVPQPPGTPDAMDKGTKKKRKRCGECPGCLKKDNCGKCGPCRSVRSHQICKMRKCNQLKTKKEKECYEKMMHQMHERCRGTPDENKNMQQVASAICGSGVAGKDGMASSPGGRNNLNGRTLNGSTTPYLPQGLPEHLGHPGTGIMVFKLVQRHYIMDPLAFSFVMDHEELSEVCSYEVL